jgi:DNA-binding transcriptional MerR regulator
MNGASGSRTGGAAPSYDVAAVARRLGVAASTLRTWHRRYGIGPSGRSPGGHRRYDPADLARLETMHDLMLQGVPPGEAARVALARDPSPASAQPAAPAAATARTAPRGRAVSSAPAPSAQPAPSAVAGVSAAPGARRHSGRGAGGRGLALSGAPALARGLARAALALDEPATTALLRTGLRRHGVIWTWDRMLLPVLVGIGERFAATGECVDAEHLLSNCVIAAMNHAAARGPAPRNSRPVLLACADEEQHSLPLYPLAAALAREGVSSRNLGMRTPGEALADAMRRTGPVVVFVWSQLPETAERTALSDLPRLRPAPRVVVGGPGWDGRPLPPDVLAVTSLREAVVAVSGAAGGRARPEDDTGTRAR